MNRRGFTLLEVTVVVCIIGLLAAIVAPTLAGKPDQARRAAATAALAELTQHLNRYRLDAGDYPPTAAGLAALVHPPNRPTGYLDRMPTDPWGHPYVYLRAGTGFTLASLGADGAEGGSGADADLETHAQP